MSRTPSAPTARSSSGCRDGQRGSWHGACPACERRIRFRRAAHALGGLAARRSDPELIAAYGQAPGSGLRKYAAVRVREWAVPRLQDDGVWRHPVLSGTVDRRPAAARGGGSHSAGPAGPAAPVRAPRGRQPVEPAGAGRGPLTFVAIDASFQSPHAVGFDLGQLLIGLVHAGLMWAASLPEVHEVIARAFLDGYQRYGCAATAGDVLQGSVGSLVVRSGLGSLPFEHLGAEPTGALVATFRERAALTRFILGLAHRPLTG